MDVQSYKISNVSDTYQMELSNDSTKKPSTDQFTSQTQLVTADIKVYTRRWFILGMFTTLATISGFQWVQLTIVEDVMVDYFNVNSILVEWTATVFSLMCIFFSIPGGWLIDHYGLRNTLLLCGFLNALGCIIKAFSTGRDDFILVFIAQMISGIAQAILLPVPPRLANVWFGTKEVSTACSIGCLGFQAGAALGFVVPPFIIKADVDQNVTKLGLEYLNWALTSISTILMGFLLLGLKEQPPSPPSIACLKQQDQNTNNASFWETLKPLMRNRGYLIILITYGINMGIYCAFSTLLNVFILTYFPTAQKHAGGIGLTLNVSGMTSLILFGWILDKTKLFKEVAMLTYGLSLVTTIVFALLLDTNIIIQYFTGAAFGMFTASFFSIGYEVATEISYPAAEGTVNSVLAAVGQLFAVLITLLAESTLAHFGVIFCLYSCVALLAIGTVMMGFIKKDYRRLKANMESENTNVEAPKCH